MGIIDALCAINLGITILWTIPYLLWQFDIIGGDEDVWGRIITFANIFETVVLIVAHIGQRGTLGNTCLGVFYGISIITLFLQLIFADPRVIGKFETIFWLIFYIVFFAIDIFGADFSEFIEHVPLVKWLSNQISTLTLHDVIELLLLTPKLLAHITKLIKRLNE